MITIALAVLTALGLAFGPMYTPGELTVYEDASATASDSDSCAYSIMSQRAEDHIYWSTICTDGETVTITHHTHEVGEDWPEDITTSTRAIYLPAQ